MIKRVILSILAFILLLTPYSALAVDAVTRQSIEYDAPFYDERVVCTATAISPDINLSGNDNMQKTYNFFITPAPNGMGFTPTQAAGFMGNLQAEAHFNPKLVEYAYSKPPHLSDSIPPDANSKGQPGYGIVQWTGGRKRTMKAFADANRKGRIDGDLSLQLEFLRSELQGSFKSSVLDKVTATTDIAQVSHIVLYSFENPAKKVEQEPIRLANAQKILQLYGGTSAAPTTASTTNNTLTEDQKIASTFTIGFDIRTTSLSTIENVVKKYRIGGIVVLGTTDANGAGLNKAYFDKLNILAGAPLIVSSDEEGIFTRYKYSFNFPSASEMGKMSDAQVEEIGKKVGQELLAKGVNTDLAPVLDVAKDGSNTVAATAGRAFSSNPATVTAKAGAFAKGLRAGGVNPVYKHFPGIGSVSGNTDKQLLTSDSLDKLKVRDLKPYEALVNQNAAAVMLNNAKVPGLTQGNEVAGTSPAAVQLLRNNYKFNGLVITDDLAAAGVPTALSDSITNSLKAGVDMPLFTYRSDTEIQNAIDKIKANKISVDSAISHINTFKGTSGSTAQPATSNCNDDGSTTAAASGQDTKYLDGFTFYSQTDPSWKNLPYGKGSAISTIGKAGCGPTAMAMVVTALTGKQFTPVPIANYASDQGILKLKTDGSGDIAGSSWDIAPIIANHWGLKAEAVGNDIGKITTILQAGGLVVAPGSGSQPFTAGGHYIVIRGVTASGKWKIGDPGSKANNDKEWDPAVVAGSMHSGGVYAITK